MTTRPKVLIAAGGTGGHLFPAQQLSEMLKGDAEIHFAGHKIETSPFFQREKIPFSEIDAHPLKKGFFRALWRGFWQSWRLIREFAPNVVVGFGSYHTFPVLLAAVILRKKLILFEANCLSGKVNRLFAPAASKVACQFPQNLKKEVLVPLLPWKFLEMKNIPPARAREMFGLDPNLRTILVFGGSQGAAFLNDNVPEAISRLKTKFQAIHLTGAGAASYAKWGVSACVKTFEKDMPLAYAAADLVISRSGAGTIAELIRFAVPALLIPYPFATEDHQRKNGDFLAGTVGGARMLLQKEATVERIAAEIEALNQDAELRKQRLNAENEKCQKRTHLSEIVLQN